MHLHNYYAVLGNPISHSKSPEIHQSFAKALNMLMTYEAKALPVEHFETALSQLIAAGLRGANVTLPFKERAYALCSTLSPEAKIAGAVNTLKFNAGEIYGHNTDGLGFITDLTQRHKIGVAQKRVLVLGAGGAARGILAPLLAQQPQQLVVSNRTLAKAQALMQVFSHQGALVALPWAALTGPFDLIINATSASLSGQFPALPYGCIGPQTFGYDLMYAKTPTVFMHYFMDQGGQRVVDGLGMLVEQAALSFALWHGVHPATETVYHGLR